MIEAIRTRNTVLLGACALTFALVSTGCPKKDKSQAGDAAAGSAAAVIPSATPAPASPPVECNDEQCVLSSVTDEVKAAIEARPNHEALIIVFREGATDTDLKTVQKLPWVTALRLESSKITDMYPVGALKDLHRLWIGATNIKSLAALATLSGLTSFDARNLDDFKDIDALTPHTKLEEVVLAGTKVSDIRGLRAATGLRKLDLTGTPVEDIKPLKGLTQLEELGLGGTRVKSVDALEKLTAVRKLSLAKSPVADVAGLKGMTKLEELDLSETKVRALSPLKEMKKLVSLSLSGAKNAFDVKDLWDMKQLAVLDISRSGVFDLKPLALLRKVKTFNANETRIHDVKALAMWGDLEELHIEGTWVRDLGPIARLKKLKRIEVSKGMPAKVVDGFKKANPGCEVLVAEK